MPSSRPQRAQFDRQTGRAYKSNAFLALPEELSLDRYLCPSDDEKAVQTNVLTGQIRSLRDRVLALEQPRVRQPPPSSGTPSAVDP